MISTGFAFLTFFFLGNSLTSVLSATATSLTTVSITTTSLTTLSVTTTSLTTVLITTTLLIILSLVTLLSTTLFVTALLSTTLLLTTLSITSLLLTTLLVTILLSTTLFVTTLSSSIIATVFFFLTIFFLILTSWSVSLLSTILEISGLTTLSNSIGSPICVHCFCFTIFVVEILLNKFTLSVILFCFAGVIERSLIVFILLSICFSLGNSCKTSLLTVTFCSFKFFIISSLLSIIFL